MNNKIKLLKDLEDFINQYVNECYKPEWRFQSKHHVLWSGNPDAKILVAQMCPDRTELSWAVKENVHDDYVLHNPAGNLFKRTAHRGGFDPKNDFFYCNVIPFMRVAGIKYTPDVIHELDWIIDRVLGIINPGLIITLGIDAFQTITKEDIPVKSFESYTTEGVIFDFESTQIIPFEDPSIIESENSMKHKPFFENIRRLSVKTYKLREHNGK